MTDNPCVICGELERKQSQSLAEVLECCEGCDGDEKYKKSIDIWFNRKYVFREHKWKCNVWRQYRWLMN